MSKLDFSSISWFLVTFRGFSEYVLLLNFHSLSICENLNQDDPITISDNCPIFEEILKLFITIVKYKTTIRLPILELILFFILKLTHTYFSLIDIRLIHRNLSFWGVSDGKLLKKKVLQYRYFALFVLVEFVIQILVTNMCYVVCVSSLKLESI